eukprot:5149181-Alexandrium_andersonii.AAC.1
MATPHTRRPGGQSHALYRSLRVWRVASLDRRPEGALSRNGLPARGLRWCHPDSRRGAYFTH